MSEFRIVLVTAPDRQEAERLAVLCIEAGLAPCVNIVPSCLSLYRWQGALQRDEEALMVIKTRADSFEALAELVGRHHPYEVPEIISLPLDRLSPAYAAYLGGYFEG